MRIFPVVWLLVAMPVFVADGHAAKGPLARCERSKLKVASRSAMGALRCHANAADRGEGVNPACLDKVGGRLSARFAAAESKSPCPRSGEAAAVLPILDDVATALGAALGPSSGRSKCAKLKLLAAGRRFQQTLAAQGRHAARPEAERLGTRLAQAADHFTAGWAKAEAQPDCVTTGDEGTVASQVDGAGTEAVDEVRGTLADLGDGRLVGTALRFDALGDARYREIAARHFNYASTWGETVWVNVEPTQGVFNLAPLDQVVGFAEANGMPLKGITLVWHELLPAWMTDITDPVEFYNAMERHITTLVGGYAGRIAVWDVVNEAVSGGAYRDTPFLARLGPGYIADAFDIAHQADPSALLFYNDFGIEDLGPSSDFVYQMVIDLLAQGVPIHGVGFQMHDGVTLQWNPARASSIQQNLQRFADLGLLVQLAEAESSMGSAFSMGNRRDELREQREAYHGMVAVCMAVPGCHMNFFGFTDNYYWPIFFNRDPLMFDRDYIPKPAFFGVRDALLGY